MSTYDIAEQRQGDGVVAAEREQHFSARPQFGRTRPDLRYRSPDVERRAGDVPRVGDLLRRERQHLQAERVDDGDIVAPAQESCAGQPGRPRGFQAKMSR